MNASRIRTILFALIALVVFLPSTVLAQEVSFFGESSVIFVIHEDITDVTMRETPDVTADQNIIDRFEGNVQFTLADPGNGIPVAEGVGPNGTSAPFVYVTTAVGGQIVEGWVGLPALNVVNGAEQWEQALAALENNAQTGAEENVEQADEQQAPQEEYVPTVGHTIEAVNVVSSRSGYSEMSPITGNRLEIGDRITIEEVLEVGDDVWVGFTRSDNAAYSYAAYSFDGTVNFVPAVQDVLGAEAQSAPQEVEAQLALPQAVNQPIDIGNGISGFFNTVSETPAFVAVPEGGHSVFAEAVTNGIWMITTYMGNPDDHSINDGNSTVEKDFTGQALWVMIIDENISIDDSAHAVAQELLDSGLATTVTIDGASYTPQANVQTFGLIGTVQEVRAQAQASPNMAKPRDAHVWDSGYGWTYVPVNNSPIALPLQGEYSYASGGTFTVNLGDWSYTVTSDGTVLNIFYFDEQVESTQMAVFTDFVASNFAFMQVHSGPETMEQSMTSNMFNGFRAKNCGRGCQTVVVHHAVITDGDPVVTSETFLMEDFDTDGDLVFTQAEASAVEMRIRAQMQTAVAEAQSAAASE